MGITTFPLDGVTVVALTGDLDDHTAEQIKRALGQLIEGGRSRLVMDLEGVTGLDSTGLGALVWAMKRAWAAGGDLRLCSLPEHVHTVLYMTRLNATIRVYPDRQQAIASWD